MNFSKIYNDATVGKVEKPITELTEEQREACRIKAIGETTVIDAVEMQKSYYSLLLEKYKEKLKEKYRR